METGGIIALVVCLLLLVVAAAAAFYWFVYRKRMKKRKQLFMESKAQWDESRDEYFRAKKSPAPPRPPSPVPMRPHQMPHVAIGVEQEILEGRAAQNGEVATIGVAYDEEAVIRRLRANGWTDEDLIKAGKWRPMSSKEMDDVIEELEARQRLSGRWEGKEDPNKSGRNMSQVVESVERELPEHSYVKEKKDSVSSSSSSDLGMEKVEVTQIANDHPLQQEAERKSDKSLDLEMAAERKISSSSSSSSSLSDKMMTEVQNDKPELQEVVVAVAANADAERASVTSSTSSSSSDVESAKGDFIVQMETVPTIAVEAEVVEAKIEAEQEEIAVKAERRNSSSSESSSSTEGAASVHEEADITASAAMTIIRELSHHSKSSTEEESSESSGEESDDERSESSREVVASPPPVVVAEKKDEESSSEDSSSSSYDSESDSDATTSSGSTEII